MTPKQLRLSMNIPITGKPYCRHIIDRIDEATQEEIPEGSIVQTKQISIKKHLKPNP